MAEIAKPERIQFSLRTAIILLVLIGGTGFAVVVAIRRYPLAALEAEYTFHATECALRVVEHYVQEHPGKWPESWSELEKTPVEVHEMYAWPKDAKEIEARVAIDFTARLEDLARQTQKTFHAVRPVGPSYCYPGEADHLLELIRKNLESQTDVPKSQK